MIANQNQWKNSDQVSCPGSTGKEKWMKLTDPVTIIPIFFFRLWQLVTRKKSSSRGQPSFHILDRRRRRRPIFFFRLWQLVTRKKSSSRGQPSFHILDRRRRRRRRRRRHFDNHQTRHRFVNTKIKGKQFNKNDLYSATQCGKTTYIPVDT